MDIAKPKQTEDLENDKLPRCTKSKVNGMDPSLVRPYTNRTESILKKLCGKKLESICPKSSGDRKGSSQVKP